MTAPAWQPVDDDTATLLDLLADDGSVSPSREEEWAHFLTSLRRCADRDGLVRPNDLRPLLRDHVKPQRVGAFTHRALSAGLVEYTGDWQLSDDTAGRNGGKPSRIMRWIGGDR